MEWFRLRICGVKDGIIKKLMENFEDYEDIFKLDKNLLQKYLLMKNNDVEMIYKSRDIDLELELEKLSKKNIKVISMKDENYPESLRNISSPPIFLYYSGDLRLLKKKKIAIVGTRKATNYGKVCCEKIVGELVKNKIVTVSGLALGIDSVCHSTTLNKYGKTIAVVGSGIDVIYPKDNYRLWKNIQEYGLIISEFAPGTQPFSYNFPLRNRIIVGISEGVVVVESQNKGGSLITAELALDEGRDVYAVPGDIFSPSSSGCNQLIKDSKAKLITSGQDIFEDLDWDFSNVSNENKIKLTDLELKVYNVLNREKNLDEIIQETQMKASEILAILMELEFKKYISSVAGGKYRRKNDY